MLLSRRTLRMGAVCAVSSAAMVIAAAGPVLTAHADDTPGTIPPNGVVTNEDPLTAEVSETGKLYLSTDGSGSNDAAGTRSR